MNAFAQKYPRSIDSLLTLAKTQESPQKKALAQLQAVKAYSSFSVDSCIVLIDSLLDQYKAQKFDFGIAQAKSLKSWYISYQSRYEEGLKLGLEAMDIQEKLGTDSLGLAATYMRLALSYIHFENVKESKRYFEKAQHYYEALNDTIGLDMVLNNIGAMLSDSEPEKAIEMYKRSLELRKNLRNYDFWIAYSYFNIGSAYLTLKQFDSALTYLQLSEETFRIKAKREVPAMVILGLGQYYYEVGNYSEAEKFCRKALASAKGRNHTEIIIESTYLLAEVLNKLNKYSEAYQRLMEFQDLKNDFDSINNASQIAEIELKYNAAKKEQQIAELKSEKSLHDNELKQAKWTSLFITILSLLIVLIIAFFFTRRQQKQKLHASKLEAGLAEIKLVALRAQMNPHFIFNCINTAQYFVISAEKEAAYDFLANFAKLLRLVLENSGKTYVPLEDELKQIELYIELELIRFSEKFTYSIEVDPELGNGVFEIPSMILQPFVENAILHGLMNKEENASGNLSIELELKKESIQCKIKDNGVGRKMAQEIKSQKEAFYQSAALPNIKERLAILSKVTQTKIEYTMEDIKDNGETGTQVIIDFPFH